MKKLFAVLLALTLVLSMGTVVFAEGTAGTITISNALNGATYSIYKMFDFAPVAGSETQGRYSVVSGWEDFLKNGEGGNYLEVDADAGTIKWIGIPDDEGKAALAKAAVAYAKDKNIEATAIQTATADGIVSFENLDLGYYAIDTSLGTVCALTNVNKDFEAHEKNEKPDIDKYVQEDSKINSADKGWGKVNDADIDQQVNYKSTITVGYGVTSYVMHDKMEAGLTFNNDIIVKAGETVVDASNYTVTTKTADGDTFEVAFDDDYISDLAKGTKLTVYYSANLNENAKIVDDGNDNTVYLSYGEDSKWETAKHTTSTYTWKTDVLKYTKNGEEKVKLAGAEFMLLTIKGDEASALRFTDVTAEGAVPTYKLDKDGSITVITTDDNGKFELVGLDEGVYYLHEKEAPEGYNKLAEDETVTITSEYNETALTATYKINGKAPATIEVENKTGGLLPETGGIGTTIFYVVGGILMLAAIVLLVSKKRMASFA